MLGSGAFQIQESLLPGGWWVGILKSVACLLTVVVGGDIVFFVRKS